MTTFVRADIAVAAPPPVPKRVGTSLLARLMMPAVALLAGGGMVAAMLLSDAPVPHSPMFLLFPVMMAGSAIASAAQAGGGRQQAAELDDERARYLTYLRSVAGELHAAADAQREWLRRCHPSPQELWAVVGGSLMWGRRPDDENFCDVRIGVGSVPAATVPISPGEADDDADPITWTALRRLIHSYSAVPAAPVTVGLRAIAVTIEGDGEIARALVRAMVCQLTVSHSPTDVAVVAAVNPRHLAQWDWLKWLPHNQHRAAADQVGPLRMVYSTVSAALAERPRDRHVVIVADGVEDQLRDADIAGVTILGIGSAHAQLSLRWQVGENTLIAIDQHGGETVARPDQMTLGAALVCARRIAQHGGVDAEPRRSGWLDLIGLPDPRAHRQWQGWWDSTVGDQLRVPIGSTPAGAALHLDINEAAQQGMGPHGLCVGATGSGKSELLRTVALGMIARHSPSVLNLILVDFKGGASFLDLARAPHVSAVITNLAEEAHLVERMRDALTGEIHRRQQILRAAGNLAGVTDYHRARQEGQPLAALPTLFVIVDEFSELLSQHPDFIDVFVAIGRLGRSLGIHLLLASQRLDEGRLRGLDSHLSYRICLKTLSANESRMTIGVPDAYELPGAPGAAYLKVGAAEPIRFQSAFVSGRIANANARRFEPLAAPTLFTAAPIGRVTGPTHLPDESSRGITLVDAVLDSLAGQGPQAHRVWLPPLIESPALEAVLADYPPQRDLVVPIGVSDHAFEQRRIAVMVDLSGAAGNVAVVGGPQAGKSTALRTLVAALALRHDPRRVQFYCLDFGGGGLSMLAELPHVGAVVGRRDADLVRRTVAEVAAVLRNRASGTAAPDGDVFLVVDGWHAVRQDFDDLEPLVTAIAAEGLSHGVHVVLGAARWADIRPALKDQIGTRIELRLGDPADSEIDRRRARAVPLGCPGHGLTPDGLPFVTALPELAGSGALLRARYGDDRAPAIRLLPARIDHNALPAADDPALVMIGLDEDRLATVTVDFHREPHLLILGNPQSGKTATLRMLCREILRTAAASQAQLILLDPRRSLLGEFDELAGYLATPAAVAAELPALIDLLRCRLPGPEVTHSQLRARSWWTGPELYLVVDDYDLLAGAGASPLSPLVELLPHARDVGLHLVIARRSGGAARALYEPVLAAVRELGAMGLQLSGSPDEGALLGTRRPRVLPPGRGFLSTRAGGEQVVQVAWTEPR